MAAMAAVSVKTDHNGSKTDSSQTKTDDTSDTTRDASDTSDTSCDASDLNERYWQAAHDLGIFIKRRPYVHRDDEDNTCVHCETDDMTKGHTYVSVDMVLWTFSGLPDEHFISNDEPPHKRIRFLTEVDLCKKCAREYLRKVRKTKVFELGTPQHHDEIRQKLTELLTDRIPQAVWNGVGYDSCQSDMLFEEDGYGDCPQCSKSDCSDADSSDDLDKVDPHIKTWLLPNVDTLERECKKLNFSPAVRFQYTFEHVLCLSHRNAMVPCVDEIDAIDDERQHRNKQIKTNDLKTDDLKTKVDRVMTIPAITWSESARLKIEHVLQQLLQQCLTPANVKFEWQNFDAVKPPAAASGVAAAAVNASESSGQKRKRA